MVTTEMMIAISLAILLFGLLCAAMIALLPSDHGFIKNGLDDLKVGSLPQPKKVDRCQHCGRAIVPGREETSCPGCGAPIIPIPAISRAMPAPGPPNPLFRTGLESNLWDERLLGKEKR